MADQQPKKPRHRPGICVSPSNSPASAIPEAPPAKTILLLGATFSTGNMGVGALASGAITILRTRFPGANVVFLDYGATPKTWGVVIGDTQLSVPLINLRFSWKIFLKNNVAYLLAMATLWRVLGARFRKRIETNPWIRSISRAELAVAVSGGDSFSDIYGLARFLYVYLPQVLVIMMGRKLVLLPQTIGPFEGAVSRSLAASLLRQSTLAYSRDHVGVEEARLLLGSAEATRKIRFCYDMGFLLAPRRPKGHRLDEVLPRSERLLVGLNVSGLLLMGGYRKDNAFGLQVDYEALVERTIEFFVKKHESNVMLVPHVFGEDDESDSVACATLYGRLAREYEGHLFLVSGTYDQSEIKHVIGQCQFFIGARMHACIAALSQAIPAIGIAYSRKFDGVFDSIGMRHLVADPRSMSMDEILTVIASALRQRESLREQLRATMNNVRQGLLTCLNEVA